ncbi:arylmalonate decarboxylase [Novosphingobium sp. PC22D]|uniref:maleate cis-trans isomerase family protein n=1 Tax=Novosphingobium sp. PC22D TaxID=1962403 RepID=UPI000BF0F8CD|nr:arylmalonate decarboxylase [Novosphingobium sp. PC22D]PEQ11377.1 arylmalonate decarboxylase [Novosphingobium sp. PC22D]
MEPANGGPPGKDNLGFRKLFGVLGPSTNTTVQPEFDDMRPYGVTNHYSRIIVDDAQAVSDETFMAGTQEIDAGTADAVRGVMTCRPDYLVMGMSAVTFYGGAEGGRRWRENIESIAGVGVSTGAEAVAAALGAYGNISKVAFVSPYWPSANDQVRNYLSDHGFESVRDVPLRCRSWTQIAQVPDDTLREAFHYLEGDDVEALIQVGTNLCTARFAAAAELWLGKPVIAINTATYWHALRANGVTDKVPGFGRLLAEF